MPYQFVDPIHIYGPDAIRHGVEAVHGPESKGWGPQPTGFPFQGFTSPRSLVVDNAAVSQGLANAGLTCSENNAAAIAQGVRNLSQVAPTNGLSMRQASGGSEVPEWHWTIEGNPPWQDYMSLILAHHQLITENYVFPVAHELRTKRRTTTTNVAIQTIFDMVAEIAGDLETGHVDLPQLSKQIASHVKGLSTEVTDSYHVEKTDQQTFLASEATNPNGDAKAIAGIIYNYSGTISDYKDKKHETHSTEVTVEKWSMVFTSEDVFNHVYQWVLSHT
ncbi:MAG: hypothetical protein AAGC60_17260 [Acidobacteriota bacterium]